MSRLMNDAPHSYEIVEQEQKDDAELQDCVRMITDGRWSNWEPTVHDRFQDNISTMIEFSDFRNHYQNKEVY